MYDLWSHTDDAVKKDKEANIRNEGRFDMLREQWKIYYGTVRRAKPMTDDAIKAELFNAGLGKDDGYCSG